jgi:hypothetical protein
MAACRPSHLLAFRSSTVRWKRLPGLELFAFDDDFFSDFAYVLERGRVGVLVQARILRCKINEMAAPDTIRTCDLCLRRARAIRKASLVQKTGRSGGLQKKGPASRRRYRGRRRANHLADLSDREAAAPWRQGRPNAHGVQRTSLLPGMPLEAVPARASPQPPRAGTVFFDAGIVPDVAVEQLWLELIGCPATTFVVVNRFDCATAHPL